MARQLNRYRIDLHSMPVTPKKNQIFFVENRSNPELEEYIERNYETLCGIFSCRGLEFVYLPKQPRQVDDNVLFALARYQMPWLTDDAIRSLSAQLANDTKVLFEDVPLENDLPVMVNAQGTAISIDVSKPDMFGCIFRGIAEAFGKPVESGARKKVNFLKKLFPSIMEKGGEFIEKEDTSSGVEVMCCEDSIPIRMPECHPDTDIIRDRKKEYKLNLDFESELETPPDDELRRLYKQVEKTVPGYIIKKALKELLKSNEVISTLLITGQGRIFLPQYNNIEIRLMPKAKALYFLFLKHPEGICFKDLPDHRDELARYYRRFARSGSPEAIEEAIDYMVYVLSGDADVQRTRIKSAIKEAFTGQICEMYAQNYTIEGTKGQLMKVNLPEDKIVWELDI